MNNIQVILKQRPDAIPQPEHFALREQAAPEPADGQLLIRTLFLSLDPYMGSAIKGRHMSGRVAEGEVLGGETIGRVVRSHHKDFAEGDLVISRGGWQKYSIADGNDTGAVIPALSAAPRKLPDMLGISPSAYLGVLGMPGLTAYAAAALMSELKPGQTFVTMGASGAVGSAAGQIARIMGARAVGIAGSAEKCAAVTDLFGFEDCVNYKTDGWQDALAAACPDGIDCHLDFSGGKILEGVMPRLGLYGRILICGLMDQYNSVPILAGPSLGPIIARRAVMKGLVVYDYWDKMAEYRKNAMRWIAEGRLLNKEEITEGLEGAPVAFSRLMSGGNFGKVIVKVAAE